MKEKITRDENTLYRFTNWVDTLVRRTRYAYIKKNQSTFLTLALTMFRKMHFVQKK